MKSTWKKAGIGRLRSCNYQGVLDVKDIQITWLTLDFSPYLINPGKASGELDSTTNVVVEF